jgi:hypothetical protein
MPTTRCRTVLRIAVLLFAGGAAGAACDLNPQPIPPGLAASPEVDGGVAGAVPAGQGSDAGVPSPGFGGADAGTADQDAASLPPVGGGAPQADGGGTFDSGAGREDGGALDGGALDGGALDASADGESRDAAQDASDAGLRDADDPEGE